MGRQRVGDDIRSGRIIELYQLVVYEVLNTVSQMETFLKCVPFGPKMVFSLLGWVKIRRWRPFPGPLKHWHHQLPFQ